MNAALRELIDARLAIQPPPLPSAWPAQGQSESEWVAQVVALRAAAEEPIAAAVAAAEGKTPLLPAVASSRTVSIPVVGGSILARVYRPSGDGPHPAVVLFHGGGWWVGGGTTGLAIAEAPCQDLCAGAGVVVVNVDYRLAPEHRFPVPLEDCYSATLWVAEHASALSVDADRIGVSGGSAGANLAAAVALLAKRRSGPAIRFQQLLLPALDATLGSPSIAENASVTDLPAEALRVFWDFYAGPSTHRGEPLLSPLLQDDLSGVAAAQIVVGEYDTLRDDGLRYADRLREAGVPVTLVRHAMAHATFTPDVGAAYLQDVLTGLRDGLKADEAKRALP